MVVPPGLIKARQALHIGGEGDQVESRTRTPRRIPGAGVGDQHCTQLVCEEVLVPGNGQGGELPFLSGVELLHSEGKDRGA